jgi:mono/diheme cytochrome c family protein
VLQTLKFSLAAAYLLVCTLQPVIAEDRSTSTEQRQIDRGRYLVEIGGCNDCHTAGYSTAEGRLDESRWLMGSDLGWRGGWGTTYATNLRLLMSSLTEQQWMVMARSVRTRPPMAWWVLREMSEQDLKALYTYVKWLGPAGELAPSYAPPGQKPTGPVVQFPE